MTGRPRVTIAGGGIAGLTAALRLAERGYQVKVYEQNSMLDGDLRWRTAPNGVQHDVYPHMYLNWYHNFWRLLGDISDARPDENFVPFSSVKQ
jgi:phytoene dehydrogenase-like protein